MRSFFLALPLALIAVAALAARLRPTPPPPDELAGQRRGCRPPTPTRAPPASISKVVTPGTSDEKADGHRHRHRALHRLVAATGGCSTARSRADRRRRFRSNSVMAGWRECVQLMTLGEKRRCWVPQELAYKGQAGRPKGTVVFDIELMDTRGQSADSAARRRRAPPDDAKRTPTGLAYKVLRPGNGVRNPEPLCARVTVHYTGWTTDGKMFDSSVARGQPATIRLDEVIKGWTEGVQLMVEGERTRFWVPENLAYGGKGDGPRGMLVFDIELIRIEN